MAIIDQITQHLGNIKSISGVENVILTQKDGVPIKSLGVWFSKDEIFRVCSATSAIYAVAQRIHPTLNHVLIEGDGAKIFIAPIGAGNEYYMAVTTQTKVNLGHVFMRMSQSVNVIHNILQQNSLGGGAPLRAFTEEERARIHDAFQIKPETVAEMGSFDANIQLSEEFTAKLEHTMRNFAVMLPGILSASVIMQGGYLLCHHNSPSENHAAMVFSLYDTARRLAWLVKNMFVTQVLCISGNINHAIYELNNALFSVKLDQNQLRLGMMRLLVTSVINDLNEIIRTAPKNERPSFNFDAPMVFKPQIRGTML